jgi:hypothetical protein
VHLDRVEGDGLSALGEQDGVYCAHKATNVFRGVVVLVVSDGDRAAGEAQGRLSTPPRWCRSPGRRPLDEGALYLVLAATAQARAPHLRFRGNLVVVVLEDVPRAVGERSVSHDVPGKPAPARAIALRVHIHSFV